MPKPSINIFSINRITDVIQEKILLTIEMSKEIPKIVTILITIPSTSGIRFMISTTNEKNSIITNTLTTHLLNHAFSSNSNTIRN